MLIDQASQQNIHKTYVREMLADRDYTTLVVDDEDANADDDNVGNNDDDVKNGRNQIISISHNKY